jgi:MFS family permease
MSIAKATTIRSARFRAVIGMTLVIMIGFGIVVPALPLFVKSFGRAEAAVGIVVFAFSLTRLFGDFFAGGLIDRVGERTVTALGAGIVGVSSLAAGASRSFAQLVVLRGLGGIGSAFFLGGLMAYLIGTTPPEERGRAMGVFQGSVGVGFFVGPALGGALLAFTRPNVAFYIYGSVCLACVPLALRALGPEHLPSSALADASPQMSAPAPSVRRWSALLPLLRSRAYRAALAASALTFLVSSAEFTLIPTFWHRIGETRATSGLPFAASALLGLIVIWHAGSLTDRRGRKFALLPGLFVLGLGNALLGYSTTGWMVVSLMGLTGLSGGYIRPGPSAIVGDVSTADSRAIAVSGYRIAGDIGAIIGPLVAGFTAQYAGYKAAFVAIGVCALLVFVLATFAEETAPARTA